MDTRKLVTEARKSLDENRANQWYDNLWKVFQRAFAAGNFEPLSAALGHDPSYVNDDDADPDVGDGDGYSPQDLAEDVGWTWDHVREELLQGRGTGDMETIEGVLQWLGIDPSGIEDFFDEQGNPMDDLFFTWIPSKFI